MDSKQQRKALEDQKWAIKNITPLFRSGIDHAKRVGDLYLTGKNNPDTLAGVLTAFVADWEAERLKEINDELAALS